MRLMTELTEDVEVLVESTETGEKKHYIQGVFMQSDVVNRNKRIYPSHILNEEVNRYVNEFVSKRRALGELDHPDGAPKINMKHVSHLIENLDIKGTDVFGRALILDTPMGNIAKSLLNEGVQLGVSSRALGNTKKNSKGIDEVQKNFKLFTVDIVADPSAPNAFVNSLKEGKEWVWNNGVYVEQVCEEMVEELDNKFKKNSKMLEKQLLERFYNTLKSF